MKKIILSSILTATVLFTTNAQIVNIPDPVFKAFLVNHSYTTGNGAYTHYLDANHDGEIQVSEAASYTAGNFRFWLYNAGISDLTGIEAFKAIKILQLDINQLTFINVDGCTSLEELSCNSNPLGSVTINNSSLKILQINNCSNLTTLNLGGCTALEKLTCQSNPILTNVNLTGCTKIQELRVNMNPLLSTLTLSHYQEDFTYFQGVSNGLTSMDFSKCKNLDHMQITNNQLTSLNLANGKPQSFGYINTQGNPDLTCIKVDNVSVSEYLWGNGYPYHFDSWTTFNTDCNSVPSGPCIVNIPDANFKAALIANAAINTDGNNEIECTEAEAYTGSINVDNIFIRDLTGIEAFVNITSFSSNNNQTSYGGSTTFLENLNVSNFTSLTSVSCTGNVGFKNLNASGCTALTTVNVSTWLTTGVSVNLSGCTALTSLNLSNKKLNALNVNGCTALTNLNCSDNLLTTLDISTNQGLTELNCSKNQLNTLNTFNNTSLANLNCSYNQLPYLFVSLNTGLTNLNCSYNNLTYLDVNNNAALISLNCSHNNLNALSANNNPALTTMDCSYNNLTTLNVNIDAALTTLNCGYNQLTTVDVSNNPNLQTLWCDYNNLPSVDVSSNLALRTLSCSGNNLPTIDLSNNLDIRRLYCDYNQLSELDLNVNTELMELSCSYNQLTNLDLQNNSSLFIFYCTKNQLTDLDLSNTHVIIALCDSNNLQTLNLANGYNTNAVWILANENPELICVQVDDANYSNTNWVGDYFLFDPGVVFNGNCGLGISGNENNHSLSIYPNPTNGIVYFSEQINVQVTNALGQIIADRENVNSIDLSNQTTGVYFISFIGKNGEIIQRSKIVKE